MSAPARDIDARLRQIEDLLRFPGAIGHGATVRQLALSIARDAPTPAIAHFATQLAEAAPAGAADVQASKVLWKLREALQALAG
jgi:hypothetical protein